MPSFLHHLLEASLPVLKICLLGAVGAGLSSAVSMAQSCGVCGWGGWVRRWYRTTTAQPPQQCACNACDVAAVKHWFTVSSCCFSQGVLDQQGRRTLSKLIYCLFTPALTFTKLAPVLTGQHLILWMPLAINMFVRCVWIGLDL